MICNMLRTVSWCFAGRVLPGTAAVDGSTVPGIDALQAAVRVH